MRRARSRFGRVVEDRLRREARRERVGVEVRDCVPTTRVSSSSNWRARTFAEMMPCSICSVSGRAATGMASRRRAKPGERAEMGVDRRPAEVLEQVVVEMDAVHRGARSGAPRTDNSGSRRQNAERVRRRASVQASQASGSQVSTGWGQPSSTARGRSNFQSYNRFAMKGRRAPFTRQRVLARHQRLQSD